MVFLFCGFDCNQFKAFVAEWGQFMLAVPLEVFIRLSVLNFVQQKVFAVPVILQAQPEQVAASPFGETAIRTWQRVAELPRNFDWWHLAGLSSALLAAVTFAMLQSIYTAKRSRQTTMTL